MHQIPEILRMEFPKAQLEPANCNQNGNEYEQELRWLERKMQYQKNRRGEVDLGGVDMRCTIHFLRGRVP